MALSKRAALEIVEISGRAEKLARGSANERKQADILVQRIASIKLVGLASSEVRELYSEALVDETTTHLPRTTEPKEYRGKFESYVAGKINDREFRDFLAGTQSITATAGASGGFTVPFAYDDLVREAMAQLERSSISLRPCWSASRPHSGDAKAATKDVEPLRMPAHMSIAASE